MIHQVAVNAFLALAWTLLLDQVNAKNFIMGYVIGAAILAFYYRSRGDEIYLGRLRSAIVLVFVFIWEQIVANVQVAMLVLTPGLPIYPGIIKLPLEVERDLSVTLVANMITLTPGTLSVDISQDGQYIYVHAVDIRDPAGLIRTKARFERLAKEVFE